MGNFTALDAEAEAAADYRQGPGIRKAPLARGLSHPKNNKVRALHARAHSNTGGVENE